MMNSRPHLMGICISLMPIGQVAGAIHDILPARQIVEEMVQGAIRIMRENATKIVAVSKL
jgi:hypothetical protein